MRTSDESGSAPSADQSVEGAVNYQFLTVKTIRGRETAARTKHESEGWEFVSQTTGTLRSELTFRKPKPKALGAYVAQGYAAFRRLQPTTQKRVLAGVGGVIGLLVLWGTVSAAFGGDGEKPEASKPAAAQSEKPTATAEPTNGQSEEPSEEPTEESEASETPEVDPYSYEGPKYETVITEKTLGPGKPTQYWVLTAAEFKFANESYKDQVKLILADLARDHGSAEFIANVVTNKEIALAESITTSLDFSAERGDDYVINTILPLEEKGWVANYTGGTDPLSGQPSEDPSAYEILWRPYADSELETWKAEASTSPAATEAPSASEPSAEPTPDAGETAGTTLTVECVDPNDLDSVVAFTIGRSDPDFSEAWSTPIPVDKKLDYSMCSEADTGIYGGGPRLTPVSAVEQTIWNSAKGNSIYKRQRSTLTIVYVQCVEHDTPALLKDYPSAPNLVEEARNMLLLCPNHPNAAAMKKRIVVQAGFGQQIANGETIRGDDTFVVGQDVEPGTYRTFTAGGVFSCIWSRRNASDLPIAQGGANQGRAHEITVTIAPSDYSFYTEGCGVWFRL